MTSRDFCYWLQGYFEISGDKTRLAPISVEAAEVIKNHLAMVFKHEIDPSHGNTAHQQALDQLHNPPEEPGYGMATPSHDLGNVLIRC